VSQSISIETAYNVTVDYELASAWDRTWAYLIDQLILFGYITLLIYIVSSFENPPFAIIIIGLLPFIFYSVFFETVNQGKTIGKLAMGIQVVSLDGKNLRLGQIISRWLLRFLDLWILSPSLAFLAVVSTAKAQRIGDMIADTSVIRLKQKADITKTVKLKLPEGFKGKHPQVRSLKERDIDLLKKVIRDKTNASFKLQKAAAEHLQSLLHMDKADLSSKDFLKLVVYEYTYFQRLDSGLITEEE